MLSIGDFARLGQVSVRMLRHYDRLGLLTPARVDPHSGYRSYDAAQLARLNRVVALKELGFTLQEVHRLLEEDTGADGAEQLRGMLRLRRAELEREHAATEQRLSEVERRLRLIEKEDQVSQTEYVRKPLPAVRLAARRADVTDLATIGEVVGPLFAELGETLGRRGASLADPVASYQLDDDDVMHIVVGYAYGGAEPDPDAGPGAGPDAVPGTGREAGAPFEVVTLPGSDDAVCAVHLGAMDTIGDSWQELGRAIESMGLSPTAPCREHYLRAEPVDDQSDWVTELQQPCRPGT